MLYIHLKKKWEEEEWREERNKEKEMVGRHETNKIQVH